MKKLNKILSVGLSLAMCATMVAPAFALDINQAYIDGLNVKEKNGYKYVELTATEDDHEFNMTEDITTNSTLWFKGEEAVLNMNGHTLDHNNATGSAIRTEKTDLTINGAAEEGGEMGTITGGNASNGMYNGGGIFSLNADLTLNDVKFEGNTATLNGSAVWANFADNVTMNNVVAQNNEVTGGGGGTIAINNTKTVDLDKIIVDNNTTGGAGGGLVIQSSGTVTVDDSKITNNTSTGAGSIPNHTAVAIGGGAELSNIDKVTMTNVEISGNKVQTENGAGGGMYMFDCSEITFDNCDIMNNEAGAAGGGLYVYSCNRDTTITTTNNTVIVGNKGWGGNYANDVFAYGEVSINAGSATHEGKNFDGWTNSLNTNYEKVESTKSEDGSFGNVYGNGTYGYLTSDWVAPEVPDTGTEAPDPGPSEPPTPDRGTEIEDPEIPLGEEPEVEIEDPTIPLAGLFTRADAIGYLWEQTGSPDAELSDFPDVPEDHYWAVAIGWAQDMGIALPDEEGNFRPDDLVLRSSIEPEGELQEFLDRYAVFAGVELAEGQHFYVVAGVSDDIVMGEDAQVIFDEFFAKLEAALAKQAA